jgi:hypothetical protein
MTRAVGLLPLAAAALVGCGSVSEGPLAVPKEAGESWVGLGVRPGQVAVVGIPLTAHRGNRPLTLTSVEPTHPEEARGTHVRYGVTGDAPIGSARGWKARAWHVRPVRGFRVAPRDPATILVGIAADRPRTVFIHAFTIRYRIGKRDYRIVYRVGIHACVGRQSCPTSAVGGAREGTRRRGLRTSL